MKTNYIEPQIEVIEIELEGILCASPETGGVEDILNIGGFGDF